MANRRDNNLTTIAELPAAFSSPLAHSCNTAPILVSNMENESFFDRIGGTGLQNLEVWPLAWDFVMSVCASLTLLNLS
jgi:hypothetical protein